MAKHRPIDALNTYVNAQYTHGNVTGISTKPHINFLAGDDPTTQVSGTILWDKQRNGGNVPMGGLRNERYLITGTIEFEDATTDQTINEMAAELWRVMDKYNVNNTEFWFELIDDEWNGSYLLGQIEFTIEAVRWIVAADGA